MSNLLLYTGNGTSKYMMPTACEICGSVFSRNSHLYRHQREIHKQKRNLPRASTEATLKCPHCEKRFCHESGLSRHKKSHELTEATTENQTELACVHCNSVFKSRNSIIIHLRTCSSTVVSNFEESATWKVNVVHSIVLLYKDIVRRSCQFHSITPPHHILFPFLGHIFSIIVWENHKLQFRTKANRSSQGWDALKKRILKIEVEYT